MSFNFKDETEAFNFMWSNGLWKCVEINTKEQKSDFDAAMLKESGNVMLRMKQYKEALFTYKKALLLAHSNGSIYGIILANIAAAYMSIKKYENCIIYLQLCFESNYDTNLYPKLYNREITALMRMNKKVEAAAVFTKFKIYLTKSKFSSKQIAEYISLADFLLQNTKPDLKITKVPYFIQPDMEHSSEFVNLTNKAKIIYNDEYGRHVIAKTKIKKGEPILIEKAAAFADISSICSHCEENTAIVIPCVKCTKSYCSQKCRTANYNEYHKWECQLYVVMDSTPIEIQLAYRLFFKGLINGYKSTDTVEFQFVKETFSQVIKPSNHWKFFINKHKEDALKLLSVLASMAIHLVKTTDILKYMKTKPLFANVSSKEIAKHIGLEFSKLLCLTTASPTLIDADGGYFFYMFSNFKHSCIANTNFIHLNSLTVVNALQDIEKNQQIFINYNNDANINFLHTKLINDFHCECIMCSNPHIKMILNFQHYCEKCEIYSMELKENKLLCITCKTYRLAKSMLTLQMTSIKDSIFKYLLSNDRELLKEALELVDKLKIKLPYQLECDVIIANTTFYLRSGNLQGFVSEFNKFTTLPSLGFYTLQVHLKLFENLNDFTKIKYRESKYNQTINRTILQELLRIVRRLKESVNVSLYNRLNIDANAMEEYYNALMHIAESDNLVKSSTWIEE